jgi:hypothetical protein
MFHVGLPSRIFVTAKFMTVVQSLIFRRPGFPNGGPCMIHLATLLSKIRHPIRRSAALWM